MDRKGRTKLKREDVLNNDVRKRIIEELIKKPCSIAQLVDRLKVNRGTLKHHLSILKNNKMVISKKLNNVAGKPVMFLLEIDNDKQQKYILKILQKLKEEPMSFEDFATYPDFYLGSEDFREKSNAHSFVTYNNPPLIKRVIVISKEGEKFLKEKKA
jgi:DNA-binding transcriptional ArsR family regulator